jgi:hypothetical protein
MEAQEHYKKAIVKNNDKQNAVQGLSVRGFSQELFNKKMDLTDNKSMTVENYFFTSPAIISIKNTLNTDENGRFIFIVLKESYHEVRAFLQDFCSKKFKDIYTTQEERDDYRVSYKGLPHLQLSPNAGGAVAKLTARIIKKLDDEEKTTGVPLATQHSDTWASRVVPRFSFDKNSPHPNAQKKTTSTAASITSTKTTATSPTNANDNASINSGSTMANGPSGQTVVSQDLSSVVSQLQSQAKEQSKMFKEMMEKQDKRDRRAARAQKEMMKMILKMMQNQGSKKHKKPKKKPMKTKKKMTQKTNIVSDRTEDTDK